MYKIFLAACVIVTAFLLYMEHVKSEREAFLKNLYERAVEAERAKADEGRLIKDLEATGYKRMRR